MSKRIKCFFVEQVPATLERGEHWIRRDTGEEMPWAHDFGVGAMWYEPEYAERLTPKDEHSDFWRRNFHLGPDGKVLFVLTPGGAWNIDSYCSNCTRRGEDHNCWVRHGVPPEVTVDKNGDTCAAGAGSIQCGDYHGFLRNGYLESC